MLANIGCSVFFFAILDCQGRLSCVPLVSFMNFLVCLSVCFYNKKKIYICVFILVFIGDQAILCVDKMPTALLLWGLLPTVLCLGNIAHTVTVVFFEKSGIIS